MCWQRTISLRSDGGGVFHGWISGEDACGVLFFLGAGDGEVEAVVTAKLAGGAGLGAGECLGILGVCGAAGGWLALLGRAAGPVMSMRKSMGRFWVADGVDRPLDGGMDPKALFLRVMDDMVRAGWLASHVFTEGKGHHLVWTADGTLKAMFLREVSVALGLHHRDGAAMEFDVFCHTGRFLSGTKMIGEIDPDITEHWTDLVEELGYAGRDDLLMGLVHVVVKWAPDADTQVRVE